MEPDEDGPITKADVLVLLRQHGLDESAIDAAAIELSLGTLARLEDLCLRHEIKQGANAGQTVQDNGALNLSFGDGSTVHLPKH